MARKNKRTMGNHNVTWRIQGTRQTHHRNNNNTEIQTTNRKPRKMITTEYGTWISFGGSCTTLEEEVAAAIGKHTDDYDVSAIQKAYREAINNALPDEITLHESTFYGPQPIKDVNIIQILDSTNFWKIVGQHRKR